jgi:hypothetical protein
VTISRKTPVARRDYNCGAFNCRARIRTIPAGSRYVRLYGYAEAGDKPYTLRMHLECEGGAHGKTP